MNRWARAKPEFVRRAGFVLMAGLAVKSKDAPDAAFEAFLPLIMEAATDERNMVEKAVNWALRAIGKRNPRLHVGQIVNLRRIGNPPARGG